MPPELQMIAIKSRIIRKINQATRGGRSTIDRVVEGETRRENQMQKKNPAIPVKCVKRRHIPLCLDTQNFKGIFQDSQGDQIVHLRMFASCA